VTHHTQLTLIRLDGLRTHMKIVTDQLGDPDGSVPVSVVRWAVKQLLAGQQDALRMIEDVKAEAIEAAAEAQETE
jgi:hypothetical protein